MKNLSKRQSNLSKLIALSWQQKMLLIKAFSVLTVFKGLLLVLPFNFFLKKVNYNASASAETDEHVLGMIVWSIRVVSNNMPLGFTCLVQALSAKWLLKKYPTVRIHIGVRKGADQAFSAHAWVAYNEKIILGEQTTQVFQPILEWN